ncbi:hypothetical protein GTR04_3052 [Trichophyton interdigitale]|uniref:Uncharacterized protein n=1 Tax=Trichophyton interdigitale TaxID=101480 RepID=A0A9P5CX04_9EURO|nr:hypothetical protein GY632_1499 [Trichophyton interdigitale]KAF3899132.1 hypothetical protein GY631_0737 [Trichophyton interdigitale]KAG8209560.1 hypothetical protein GTR04_3052 [Trichophyton interdigitale]
MGPASRRGTPKSQPSRNLNSILSISTKLHRALIRYSSHGSAIPGYSTPDYSSSIYSIDDDTYSITPPSHQERLEDIIGVAFDCTCYGFTPSQGCRCRNQIRQRSLNTALRLLNLGDELLRNGRDISHALELLARCVLCMRNHQYQAGALAQMWAEKVASSLAQGQSAYVTPTRSPLSQRQSAYASQPRTGRVRAPTPPRGAVFGGQRDTSSGHTMVVPVSLVRPLPDGLFHSLLLPTFPLLHLIHPVSFPFGITPGNLSNLMRIALSVKKFLYQG